MLPTIMPNFKTPKVKKYIRHRSLDWASSWTVLGDSHMKLTLTMNSLKQFVKCNTKELKMS